MLKCSQSSTINLRQSVAAAVAAAKSMYYVRMRILGNNYNFLNSVRHKYYINIHVHLPLYSVSFITTFITAVTSAIIPWVKNGWKKLSKKQGSYFMVLVAERFVNYQRAGCCVCQGQANLQKFYVSDSSGGNCQSDKVDRGDACGCLPCGA